MTDSKASDEVRGARRTPSDYGLHHSEIYRANFSGQIKRRGSTTADERKERQKDAAKVADEYYNYVSPLYENGWGQTFHYCPLTKGLGIDDSMKVYDESFARRLGLKPGTKVLDAGCGIGGPARTIAKAIGCHITGVTINKWHVERGEALTKAAGLDHLVKHMQADFLHLPFEDESFDAVYAFDALCYAADVRDVYKEIWRVLKPGAPFGFHDWVMTDEFDESDRKHRHTRNEIELGNGITNMPLLKDVRSGLKEVGFRVVEDENMAHASYRRPWYYGPAGAWWWAVDWADFKKVFLMSDFSIAVNALILKALVLCGKLSPDIAGSIETMRLCCRSVAKGGKMGIFTPMWVFITKKPEADGNRDA